MAKAKAASQIERVGRVGGEIYRKSYAGTIVSQAPAAVKNPRTLPQQTQRAKLSMVTGAYKALKTICDHSFQGIIYGAQSQNYFAKINQQNISRWNNRKNPAVANPWQISEGTIPPAVLAADPDNAGYFQMQDLEATTTWAQFRALIGPGLEPGDQITLIGIYTGTASVSPNSAGDQPAETPQIFVGRILCPAAITDETVVGNTAQLFTTAGFKLDNIAINNNVIEINDMVTGSDGVYAMGCIISRRSGSNWDRSTQYLSIVLQNVEEDVWQEAPAVDTYYPSSPYYLNMTL